MKQFKTSKDGRTKSSRQIVQRVNAAINKLNEQLPDLAVKLRGQTFTKHDSMSSMKVAYSHDNDVFYIDEDWVLECSISDLAYVFGFLARAASFKPDKKKDLNMLTVAFNLRYEIDFNGHDAYEGGKQQEDHRQFMNLFRNVIVFEDAATMSVNEIYNAFKANKDKFDDVCDWA